MRVQAAFLSRRAAIPAETVRSAPRGQSRKACGADTPAAPCDEARGAPHRSKRLLCPLPWRRRHPSRMIRPAPCRERHRRLANGTVAAVRLAQSIRSKKYLYIGTHAKEAAMSWFWRKANDAAAPPVSAMRVDQLPPRLLRDLNLADEAEFLSPDSIRLWKLPPYSLFWPLHRSARPVHSRTRLQPHCLRRTPC